jgi:hypothetical protein
MSEQAFLRYRLQVINGWPDTPLRGAYLEAIYHRMDALARGEYVKARRKGRERTGYGESGVSLY